MATLQISSGRGPGECELAVGLYLAHIVASHPGAVITREQGKRELTLPSGRFYAFKSVLVDIPSTEGIPMGIIKWICQSPLRPTHRRKNWFIEVTAITSSDSPGSCMPPAPLGVSDKRLLRFETFRSPGKGGQNVNKVESGVRVTHLPTGLTAHSVTARTQLANKKLALERLTKLLQKQSTRQEAAAEKSEWQNHNQLERGNATAVFQGLDFLPVSVAS